MHLQYDNFLPTTEVLAYLAPAVVIAVRIRVGLKQQQGCMPSAETHSAGSYAGIVGGRGLDVMSYRSKRNTTSTRER